MLCRLAQVSRKPSTLRGNTGFAVEVLVEEHLPSKQEIAGSNPVNRSDTQGNPSLRRRLTGWLTRRLWAAPHVTMKCGRAPLAQTGQSACLVIRMSAVRIRQGAPQKESMLKDTVTEQLDLLELQLRVARLFIVDAQERSYLKPCGLGKPFGCLLCKTKRYILRERFH